MGGKRTNSRAFAVTSLAAFAFASVAFATNSIADTRRVVVTKFQGPEDESEDVRKRVLEVLEEVYDIVPYRKYRIEGRRIGAQKKKSKRKAIKKVCRRVGCDAIIYGQLEERRLTLKVREGESGRMIGKFRVSVGKKLSESLTDELENELVDLIDATEPVSAGEETLVERIEEADPEMGEARTRLASTSPRVRARPEPAMGPLARRSWDAVPPEEDPEDATPSPIGLHALFGVGGSSRRLQFNYRQGLTKDELPAQMAGSPALTAVFTGVADFKAIGLSAEFTYARSIGATAAYADGGNKKSLSLKQQQWGGRLFFRRPLSRRVTLRGAAGYHQQSFVAKNPPNGLRLPDSRYSYADLGGGARILLKGARVAVTGDVAYVHVLASSGVTDKMAYGSATFMGVRGEAGVEFEASATTFVRVGLQYSHLVLSFNGEGDLLDLDGDGNKQDDLTAASDVTLGGSAMMGFHF